ncbi:MAG: hypothetical protein ACRDS0_34100 [Pseudonocardiaceae bacterium]
MNARWSLSRTLMMLILGGWHRGLLVCGRDRKTGHRDRLATEMRERIEPNTAAAGLPAGRLAEAFLVAHNR